MEHDTENCKGSLFSWKNVLKIKSWKLKDGSERATKTEKTTQKLEAKDDNPRLIELAQRLRSKGYALRAFNIDNKNLFLGFQGEDYLQSDDLMGLLSLTEQESVPKKMKAEFLED